jgi:hypothetical protein
MLVSEKLFCLHYNMCYGGWATPVIIPGHLYVTCDCEKTGASPIAMYWKAEACSVNAAAPAGVNCFALCGRAKNLHTLDMLGESGSTFVGMIDIQPRPNKADLFVIQLSSG